MHTEREDLVNLLRSRGEHDQALRASCSLPRHIDTDQDAGLLRQLDIHEATIRTSAAGS